MFRCCVCVLQDIAWLGLVNDLRRANKLPPLTVDRFELALDRFEKESFAASLDAGSKSNSNGLGSGSGKSSNGLASSSSSSSSGSTAGSSGDGGGGVSPCAVCTETEADPMNLLLVCDACSLTVHQVCTTAGADEEIYDRLISQKLTFVNRLISDNFCTQMERPRKLQSSIFTGG